MPMASLNDRWQWLRMFGETILKSQLVTRRGFHLTRERVGALQQARLQRLVRHAKARSPFYARHYAGVDVGRPVRLGDIPPITKADVMNHFDEFLTVRDLSTREVEGYLFGPEASRVPFYKNRYAITMSGGTTGQQLYYVMDLHEFATMMALAISRSPVPARLWARPPRVVMLTSNDARYSSARFAASLGSTFVTIALIPPYLPLPELLARAAPLRPDYVAGYASTLRLVAELRRRGRLAWAPRALFSSSEQLTDIDRAFVEETFGAPVLDSYSLTEALQVARECVAGRRMHLAEDYHVLENVGPRGDAVPEGETGDHVLLTNLYNLTQPLIRYLVEDRLSLDSTPCRCGLPFASIARIEGRHMGYFFVRDAGGRLHAFSRMLSDLVEEVRGVRDAQIVQNHVGEVTVNLVLPEGPGGAGVRRDAERVVRGFFDRAVGGRADLKISVHLVAELRRNPISQKFSQFISEIRGEDRRELLEECVTLR